MSVAQETTPTTYRVVEEHSKMHNHREMVVCVEAPTYLSAGSQEAVDFAIQYAASKGFGNAATGGLNDIEPVDADGKGITEIKPGVVAVAYRNHIRLNRM